MGPLPISQIFYRHRWLACWLAIILVTLLLGFARDLLPWAYKYPKALQLPLSGWITTFMKWLINDFDLGLFTFKEFTRALAWLIEQPYGLVKSLLSTGFLDGVGSYAVEIFPPLSWMALIAGVVLLGHYAQDWRLAVLTGICLAYLVVFGQWTSAMVTLSSIVIAVPIGVVGGMLLGIIGYRSKAFRAILTPVLDLMQTVPVFAYLVPVLLLFGFGPVSAMIATTIYAMPPMVRVTLLALDQIPAEVVEAGTMAGSSRRQLLLKVLLPSAKRSLMVGVNQVVMLSLNMVIIASMIGAGGLGHDVLTALKRLRIGEGVEAGVAITLLAICLDRLSQALANRQSPAHMATTARLWSRYPHSSIFIVIVIVTWIGTAYLPIFKAYPEAWQLTTGSFWNDVVRYINVNYFDVLESFKNFLLLNIMIPTKRFLLSLPWPAVVAGLMLAGWQLGGRRLGLLSAGLSLFIVAVGLWPKAMVTVYLCGLSVLIACLIGIPIGVWAARNDRVHRVVSGVIDTLQTLPSFVYLMPVVMLFRVGDFAAMLAVIAYAITPIIRYTDHGIRQVPANLIEATQQVGCSKNQVLRIVQLPLALPQIMLGVNQTIMMALSMLVITALVGTRELGQEVYIALTKADTGRGIIAGVCVAIIAIIADRMINAWATRRKQELGLEH
ncbi:MAG: glycine betaine/proline transport system permease protein [Parasphingorhabdus sp.]|jgi:glycine betaine/proline transport system permease protein